MIHQLRIYEIFESNEDAFHARFRDHAMRAMERYDFNIVAMWEAEHPERIEFVCLLRWPDEETKARAWNAIMAEQEWTDIKRATRGRACLVGEIQDRILLLTGYSPAFT